MISQLKSMFQLTKQVGNQTAIKNEKTKTGLKDMYLDAFLDRMAASYKDCRGTTAKQSVLDEFVATLPLMSSYRPYPPNRTFRIFPDTRISHSEGIRPV